MHILIEMTRKEIKKFYISLIDNPDAQWSKIDYDSCIEFTCRINNIKVECNNWILKFIYIDENRYSTKSEKVSLKDIGISKFRMIFPYFGLGYRILRRIKREKEINEIRSAVSRVSEIITKDKILTRDTKLDKILNRC